MAALEAVRVQINDRIDREIAALQATIAGADHAPLPEVLLPTKRQRASYKNKNGRSPATPKPEPGTVSSLEDVLKSLPSPK
jgi:hypothetical protein